GHFRGIDRVVRAIGERHRQIHHGEAQRTLDHVVLDAVFHRGDILFRHHAAGDRVGKLEAGAPRQGLDLHHHVAELAVAATLLLVPAAHGYTLADGFHVGHAPVAGLGLNTVLAL